MHLRNIENEVRIYGKSVSILVLMEDALKGWAIKWKQVIEIVSILVLMEDALKEVDGVKW